MGRASCGANAAGRIICGTCPIDVARSTLFQRLPCFAVLGLDPDAPMPSIGETRRQITTRPSQISIDTSG
jgi:hypothetical protein